MARLAWWVTWLGAVPLAGVALPVAAALIGQTITFPPLPGRTFGAAPFTVSATASSGLPVSFASATKSVCTVGGSTVTIVAAGTCTIQASQGGNATYAAAPKVSQSFAVARASQSIAFAAIADKALGTAAFAVTATATSGLAVTIASTTKSVCTFKSGKVTLSAIGTCTLEASQSGNGNYLAAPIVAHTFRVTSATPIAQTITFDALADRVVTASPFTIGATASSWLPVGFTSLTPAVCTVAGNLVTLGSLGTCTVRAAQPGDSTYSPAPNVDRSFAVTAPAALYLQYSYDGAGNVIGIRRGATP